MLSQCQSERDHRALYAVTWKRCRSTRICQWENCINERRDDKRDDARLSSSSCHNGAYGMKTMMRAASSLSNTRLLVLKKDYVYLCLYTCVLVCWLVSVLCINMIEFIPIS